MNENTSPWADRRRAIAEAADSLGLTYTDEAPQTLLVHVHTRARSEAADGSERWLEDVTVACQLDTGRYLVRDPLPFIHPNWDAQRQWMLEARYAGLPLRMQLEALVCNLRGLDAPPEAARSGAQNAGERRFPAQNGVPEQPRMVSEATADGSGAAPAGPAQPVNGLRATISPPEATAPDGTRRIVIHGSETVHRRMLIDAARDMLVEEAWRRNHNSRRIVVRKHGNGNK